MKRYNVFRNILVLLSVCAKIALANNLAFNNNNVNNNVTLTANDGNSALGSFSFTMISSGNSGSCIKISATNGTLLSEHTTVVAAAPSQKIAVNYECGSATYENPGNSTDAGVSNASIYKPSGQNDEVDLYTAPAGYIFNNQSPTCTIKLVGSENLNHKVAGTFTDTITLSISDGACS